MPGVLNLFLESSTTLFRFTTLKGLTYHHWITKAMIDDEQRNFKISFFHFCSNGLPFNRLPAFNINIKKPYFKSNRNQYNKIDLVLKGQNKS